MNRSGCKNCPVKPCETLYRGSICLSRRHKLGLGDPMTNADSIRAMSDEELARFLASVENRRSADGGGAKWCGMAHALNWLKQPAEEYKNGV